jgi:hypothetical protein
MIGRHQRGRDWDGATRKSAFESGTPCPVGALLVSSTQRMDLAAAPLSTGTNAVSDIYLCIESCC